VRRLTLTLTLALSLNPKNPRLFQTPLWEAAAQVGRAAEKLVDASTELESTLAVVIMTSQQLSRGDALRRHADDLLK
jgi:hypothetical protein